MGRYYDEYGNTRYDDEIAYAGDMFSRDAIAACCCSVDSIDNSWSPQGTSSVNYLDSAKTVSLTAVDSKVSPYNCLIDIADASSSISATVDGLSDALTAVTERLNNLEAKFGNDFKSSFLKRKYNWAPLRRSSLKTLGAMR